MPNAFLNKLINNSKVDHTLYKSTINNGKSTYIKSNTDGEILQLKHNFGSNISSAGLSAYSYSSLQNCVDDNYDEEISNLFYSDVSHSALTTKIVNKCYNNSYNNMYEQDADGTKNFYGIDRNKITEFSQSQSTVDSYKLMSGSSVTPTLHLVLNCCEEPLLIQPLRQMPNTNITPVIYGTNSTMSYSGFSPHSVKGQTLAASKNVWFNNTTISSETLSLFMYNMKPSNFRYRRARPSDTSCIETFWMANDVYKASVNGSINTKYAFLKPSFFSQRYYNLSANETGVRTGRNVSLDHALLSDRTSTSGSIFCQNMQNFYPTSELMPTTVYTESTSKYESLLAMSNNDAIQHSTGNTSTMGILNRMDSNDNTFYQNMYDFLTDNCDRRRHSKYNTNRLLYTSYKQSIQTTRLGTYQKGYERNPRLSIAYGHNSGVDDYTIYEPDRVLPELASFYSNSKSITSNGTLDNYLTITPVGSIDLPVKCTRLTNTLSSFGDTIGTDFSSISNSTSRYFHIKKLVDYYGQNFVTTETRQSVYKRKISFNLKPMNYILSTYIYSDTTRKLPTFSNYNVIYLKTRNIITVDFTVMEYVPICSDQRLYEMIKLNGSNLLPLFTRKKIYNRTYSNNVNGENNGHITSHDLKSGGRLMDFHYVRPDLLYKLNTYGYVNASKLRYTYDFGY